jgi:RimJ/RimL family protein N-acetyltransferase
MPEQSRLARIEIRTAQAADMPAFKVLRLRALREHPVAFSADYDAHANGDARFWGRYFDFDGSSTIYLAWHEGLLLGMTGVRLDYSAKTRHSALIWGVYVQPEWRGRQLGEAIIKACLAWAVNHGATIAKLGVATNNLPAIRCYERCGFEIYGTEPRAILFEGKYYNEHLMSRVLDE